MAKDRSIDNTSVTFEWWADHLKEVYGEKMKLRKPEEFWMNVLAHISGIGESIRKTNYDALFYHAAHALSWMICFIKKCNDSDDGFFRFRNNLTEIVGLKYPAECGHCEKKPCQCDAVKMEESEDKAAHYERLYESWKVCIANSDYTISDWIGILERIYRGRIHLQTLENIGFHLLEEGGEEAKAIRQLVRFRDELTNTNEKEEKKIGEDFLSKIDNIPDLIDVYRTASKEIDRKSMTKYPAEKEKLVINVQNENIDQIKRRLALIKMDLIIEFGDTFSWFFAAIIKLKLILQDLTFYENIKRGYSLENVLKKEYKFISKDQSLRCSFCGEKPCVCYYV